mmetsp:Transcript_32895/g.86098  ORF Transcript_32895/g.86098 Transcript_32895/m.86098 type:complete len:514 (+) Transcript_32895:123-1664(+)|eukprot:CAMPEP_0182915260 /NCGR_PEP_ID=MMETSP0105_2-20130417/207_1 /TAXON_ID=81532 ORGANISM="Acanthoeca-like sp., Strain 10tr" /NCGR_SAMPLE_ID=MMETSP0105_2 /ASSEMBLY_ACC=CAM_ASM_000205 /LENGTH=513 /DNA_ID=CAMNT_0025052103 /DNA_START=117 /DNA_END=1658 /DNA_ORIENTATION=-
MATIQDTPVESGCCADLRAPWTHRVAIYMNALAVCCVAMGSLTDLGGSASTDSVHPVGTGPVSQLGEIAGFEYSLFRYCVHLRAAAYGGEVTRICLGYDHEFAVAVNTTTGPRVRTRDGCDQFESVDLCQSVSTTTALLFAFVFVGCIALVVPEKARLFVGLATLQAGLGAAALGDSNSVIGELNAQDEVLELEWGPGAFWCLGGTLAAATAAALAALPFCTPRSDDALEMVVSDVAGSAVPPSPNGETITHDQKPSSGPAAEADIEGLAAESATARTRLADYTAFVSDAVGVPGRTATLCGLVAWIVLIAMLLHREWLYTDRAPTGSGPLAQLAAVPKMSFGAFEYCLDRPGAVSPTMTRDAFVACFGYHDTLTLVAFPANASSAAATTVLVEGTMCDLLSDARFCSLKWRVGLALVLAIVVVWCGLGVPDLTYAQSSCTFAGAACGCAATILLSALRDDANDKIDPVFKYGDALSLGVVATLFGMGAAALGAADFLVVGYGHFESAPCLRE